MDLIDTWNLFACLPVDHSLHTGVSPLLIAVEEAVAVAAVKAAVAMGVAAAAGETI